MKKKRRYIIPVTILSALLIIVISQYPKLYIATGYGAKCMASGVFVAGRDPISVRDLDLNYSIVKFTRNKIDFQNKTVTTSLWGLAPQTAVYRPGLGCTLIDGLPLDSVKNISAEIPVDQQGRSVVTALADGRQVKRYCFP